MVQNVNQFAQTPIVGKADLQFAGSVFSAQVDTTQATNLVPGQFVTVVNSTGGVPKVIGLGAQATTPQGVVLYNPKDAGYPAFSRLEIGYDNTVPFMNAAGAIARFAPVQAVQATPGNVAAWDGSSPIVGFAFDASTAANQLIRVFLKFPTSGSSSGVKELTVTATLAQINAGLEVIAAIAGKQITVTNFIERVLGNFATGTSVALQSDTTSVVVETTAEAGLTTGAVLVPGSANVTLGAGFGAALPVGEGLKLVNNGANQTVGTSITFTIEYVVE